VTARADQTVWVLGHLDDVCSDLSVFHGVRDASRLDAVVFFKLAYRLPAYQGAVAAAVARQQRERDGDGAALRGGRGGGVVDARARFRAAQAMPVASASELAAAAAPVSGLPALATITRVPG
jgi:hypothetical protein